MDHILRDPEKTARAVNLVHVSDDQPGIVREKRGKTFRYFQEEKEVKDMHAREWASTGHGDRCRATKAVPVSSFVGSP
jgi:hypothetical protein